IPIETVVDAVVPRRPADLEAFAATGTDVVVVGEHSGIDERDLAERAPHVPLQRRLKDEGIGRRSLRARRPRRRGGRERKEQRDRAIASAAHGLTARPAVARNSVSPPASWE